MSSDLFLLDGYFLSDPFSPFTDSPPIDILQTISDNNNNNNNPILQNPLHESNSWDQIAPSVFSSSPPSHQLENLSLCQTTHLQDVSNFSALEVKTEECQCQVPLQSPSAYGYQQSFGAHSYGCAENVVVKMMQRSYSSNSFDGKQPSHLLPFQPRFDSLMESSIFQPQVMSSPENNFSTGLIRRASSTGDLQKIKTNQANQRLSSSPLATESSFMEEANFKVGRYSAEERKERIHRYKAKRTQRNFNKTIKYACRKTLADNRPRIRGRFARNDETGEIPKAANLNRYEDEDDFWIEGLNEEEEEGTVGRGQFFNISGPTQLQYHGYY
ncbi:Zinc finger protein CO3 [Camellia lanceoleosa]|uniref:Zinc finger protein CO3 n=1 Tax=Camellia lanceoleosa TaxID=1840588 RepID=A0ACC0G3K4_9ERIC|nr:Zinc finger protein CO3 [Camellia lanceoleosa]